MIDPFNFAAAFLEQNAILPLLYRWGGMQWADLSFGWALVAIYGFAQVIITFAVCLPLEYVWPAESWQNGRAVWVDILYTMISRVGVLPIVSFVLFFQVQAAFGGLLADYGYVPPALELLAPWLVGHAVVTFFLYALILDASDYARHRLSHRFAAWYALHAVHHAQRQMSFWSDDRNHILDDLVSMLWFGAVALLIGIPPLQFPQLVLVLRFIESLSHANTSLSFGWLGERLIVSPRFHRVHHGVMAAGRRSVNYGAVFPIWDMLCRTADFTPHLPATGDTAAPEAMATGGYIAQQQAGLAQLARTLGRPRAG
ncbi:MAG TPA: sterol desaturase family protein [Acetobacteraceae bacterium]|nr:sterol desaturase family protein [Acetobacteraceae bacterium]